MQERRNCEGQQKRWQDPWTTDSSGSKGVSWKDISGGWRGNT